MAEVKILVEGYAKQLEDGWVASSTVCLIKTQKGKYIISDPGCNRKRLLQGLSNEDLKLEDIDYVFMSHQHPDHILLAGLFSAAKFITFDTNLMYEGDTILPFDKYEMGRDVEIIETPGHVLEHISLIVETSDGTIGIAGDAIWWIDSEEQVFEINQRDHTQAKGMDMKVLVESRKKLLEHSDFIVPGHGQMFKVNS